MSHAIKLIALVWLLVAHAPAWAQKPAKPVAPEAGITSTKTARDLSAVSIAIDHELDSRLAEAKVPASPRADDAEFLRRAAIDIIGRIPTLDEATAFLASNDPDKRRVLIDELLDSPEYGQHFRDIWRGLIDPRSDAGAKSGTEQFGPWLAEQFNRNRGWNEIVYAMLTAEGDVNQFPETGFIMAQSEAAQPKPGQLATATSRLFLGIRLQCAECHDHPFASWKQDDFWAIAAFFGRVRNSNPKGGGRNASLIEVLAAQESDGMMMDPAATRIAPGGAIVIPVLAGKSAGRVVKPRFLGGAEPASSDERTHRQEFGKWVTSAQNKYFAQAAVNRLWAHFFARGLFNPIDDFPVDEEQPASHPKLLELLTREFVAAGFDQKHMIRTICNSQAYQRTSQPLPGNESDNVLFSRMAIKTLTPEVLYDSLVGLTNVSELKPVVPGRKGSSRDPRVIFSELFRTSGDAGNPTELNYGIPQFLRRMNAEYLNNGSPLLDRLLGSSKGKKQYKAVGSQEEVIESIYLATLSRRPTADEMRLMSEYVGRRSSKEEGYRGVLWILLNSGEFVLNH